MNELKLTLSAYILSVCVCASSKFIYNLNHPLVVRGEIHSALW